MNPKSKTDHYVVHYKDPENPTKKTITLRCRKIHDSPLGLSFVCLSDFIFDTSGVVVNHIEEELRQRYEHVRSLHISIYTIVSIEEHGHDSPNLRFEKDRSNLVMLNQSDFNSPE